MVLCVDEQTSVPPRTRQAPPWAAHRGPPVRVAHEYPRQDALKLCAGFDPRTGKVYATTAVRKRQVDCIAFLEHGDWQIPPTSTTMHVRLDNVRRHKGKQGPAWGAPHPRFVFHLPPGHCSWRHQGEHWFSLLQRKRWPLADVADKHPWAERLMACVAEWNEHARPFRWSTKSVAKVMAKCENPVAKAA